MTPDMAVDAQGGAVLTVCRTTATLDTLTKGVDMPFTIKSEHLAAIAGTTTKLMPALAEWINKTCPAYEIDTPQEYSHFLAQACHETDHFKTLREYASGKA
jgi:hypothetical protein